MRRFALMGGLLLALPAAAGDSDGLVAFRAEARVELDATGHPTKIEASEDLPDAIRSYIEKRVAAYTFSPPARGDVTGAGVTYLALGACAVPAGDGYRLGLDLKGNGPRFVGARLPAPEYPHAAARASAQAEITTQLLVGADGSASLEKITYANPEQPERRAFDDSLRSWARRLKFEPEQLGGKPVATRVEVGLNFILPGRQTMRDMENKLKQRYTKAPECRMASGETVGLEPVALDSPVTVTPTSG
jgi:hypothetical protein